MTPWWCAALGDLPRECRVGCRGAGLDQLDRDHGSAAADVADARVPVLQRAEASEHQGLDLPRTCHQPVGLDGLDGSERGCTGERVAAVRASQPPDVRRAQGAKGFQLLDRLLPAPEPVERETVQFPDGRRAWYPLRQGAEEPLGVLVSRVRRRGSHREGGPGGQWRSMRSSRRRSPCRRAPCVGRVGGTRSWWRSSSRPGRGSSRPSGASPAHRAARLGSNLAVVDPRFAPGLSVPGRLSGVADGLAPDRRGARPVISGLGRLAGRSDGPGPRVVVGLSGAADLSGAAAGHAAPSGLAGPLVGRVARACRSSRWGSDGRPRPVRRPRPRSPSPGLPALAGAPRLLLAFRRRVRGCAPLRGRATAAAGALAPPAATVHDRRGRASVERTAGENEKGPRRGGGLSQ